MNTNVIVLTPTDFGKWVSQQMGARPAGATAAALMPEAALLGASGKRS
jgi:heme/copper-type cytochrome/quinol oxidase subunit 2